MKRPAFTLIEVLAALTIVASLVLLGSTLGRRYVLRQRETVAMQRLQTEWRTLQTRAEVTQKSAELVMNQTEQELVYWIDRRVMSRQKLPDSLRLKSHSIITRDAGRAFTSPRVVMVYSTLGGRYRLSFGMGWGQLIIKREMVA